jgi:glycosyltransferase involved in cell wall biosynthesis
MKIAQIAPLAESVPPRLYGGTERVVSSLTEERARLGHHVTLFASADSETSAELVPCAPRSLRAADLPQLLAYYSLMLEAVRQRADDFDVLHFHLDHLHLPLFRPFARKTVTTLHGRLDVAPLAVLYREFSDMPLVSISNSQRAALPSANWVATVHHGLAAEICPFNPAFRPSPRGGYFAFVGRVSPEKGLESAIEIARRAGARLRIAAKVDGVDEPYFKERIEPLLAAPGIEFLGEVGEAGKPALLGNATALLFPIDWPEPFGLAMIEAMSCGTPVIARPRGAVREIVVDGETGIIAETFDELVAAVKDVQRLERAACRRRVERHFSVAAMADRYEELYWRRLADSPHVPFKAPPALRPRLRARAE